MSGVVVEHGAGIAGSIYVPFTVSFTIISFLKRKITLSPDWRELLNAEKIISNDFLVLSSSIWNAISAGSELIVLSVSAAGVALLLHVGVGVEVIKVGVNIGGEITN